MKILSLYFSDEWVDTLIEEACNPSRTERLPTEELVRMQKYIKEISPSYVYTRQISIKEPFTKKVRKAMTENVKTSAYTSFLGKNVHRHGRKNAKFVNEDQHILNFARDEVFKNASTKRPARLNETLVSYMRSVGQIVCGGVQLGTCFLVTDELVLTNYHVYRSIEAERYKQGNSNLPINVLFDYLQPEQTENVVVVVEVDEEQDSELENPYLDYKFFRLKQNEGHMDRVPLGPMVRNWQLSDGRVVILGHPGGQEMQDEVCIVVGYRAMLERIRDRHKKCNGVHMTNAQLLHETEDYQGCLSYDSTFFSGASGSPVIQMNGNIVAMHTQGYTLEVKEDNTPNQEENVANQEQENAANQEQENAANQEQENAADQEQENTANQEQENAANEEQENTANQERENAADQEQENSANQEQENSANQEQENVANQEQENVANQEQDNAGNQEPDNAANQEQDNAANQEQDNAANQEQENVSGQRIKRKYSLMEFGVQFFSICTDMRRKYGENTVKKIFPNYKLKQGEEPMDPT